MALLERELSETDSWMGSSRLKTLQEVFEDMRRFLPCPPAQGDRKWIEDIDDTYDSQ
jgi:hypothetical protein